MTSPDKTPKSSVTTIATVRKADTAALVLNGADSFPEDSFEGSYSTAGTSNTVSIIEPTFKPGVLLATSKQNNSLESCIAAMEVNIDGTGHSIDLIEGKEENETEKAMLEDFFNDPYPYQSMITIRRRLRRDLEATGNGYLEVLRNVKGEIMLLNFLESDNLRLVRYDSPVQVSRTVFRNGSPVTVKINARERRFAQCINGKKTYFKEFGATRGLDKDTGLWETSQGSVTVDKAASEIIHFTVNKEAKTPYGSPRWLSQLPSILGSRKAEEFNLEFFDAGGLPPVLIMIQGGYLGVEAKEALEAHLSNKGSKHRAVVVEATSSSGSLDSSGTVSMKVERFGGDRMSDAMFQTYDKNCEDHVRTAFRLPPMFVGKAADFNFACYSDDTETLTDHGWITQSHFRVGMKVASVDPETMLMKFEVPEALSVYDVQDVPMYHYLSQRDDILVTPKHRMLFRGIKGSYRIEPVENMSALSRAKVPKTVEWVGSEPLFEFSPPPIVVRDGPLAYKGALRPIPAYDFLEFVGWYVSEGHTMSTSYAVITQSPKRHLAQVRSVARRMEGRGCFVREATLSNGCQQVMIGDYSLVKWLKEEIGEGASNKKLPQWILNLPKSQLRTLFDAMMLGDGSVDTREGRTSKSYATVSSRLAGQVQELALKLGYAANVIKSAPGTYGTCPVFRVLMSAAPESELWTSKNLTRENYTGKVHCFTVSTGVYVTRRNGKVSLQGNTAYTAYMVAEAQVFYPERDEFDTIINNTVCKALGAKSYRFRSLPLTLVDVANQLKALELVADKDIAGEEKVSVLNEITGLSLTYEKQDQPAPAPPPTQPSTGTPIGVVEQRARAVTAPPALSVVKGDSTTSLISLADKWSHLLGLYGPFYTLSEEEKESVKKAVRSLQGQDLKNFNELVASKSLVMVGVDAAGLGELCGCATNLQS